MRSRFLLLTLPLLLVACVGSSTGDSDGDDDDDVDSSESGLSAGPATANVDGSSSPSSTSNGADLRVRAGGLTVWAQPIAVAHLAQGPLPDPWVTLRLRTSRDLDGAMSWVTADGLGDARIVSPRIVEIDLRGADEIHAILSGEPLYVHLHTKSGSPRDYDVRFELQTALTNFDGSANTMVDREIRPVYVKDNASNNLRYRGRVRATGPTGSTSMAATMAGLNASLFPFPNRVFRFDFTPQRFASGLALPNSAKFTASIRSTRFTKTASVEISVARLGLTKLGPVSAWPEASCKPSVDSCIQAAGASATDLSACGSYRDVTRCIDP